VKSKRDKPPMILVVEDEATVRALAESILETLGYRTLSAATAREAIALFEQKNSIDLLFTDIELPDGADAMDGLALARRAVELCPDLRVIYTTGGGRTDGMAALFVDESVFLAKPYTRDQLIDAVEEVLGR
jgi:CheY-like chemotaxis protein